MPTQPDQVKPLHHSGQNIADDQRLENRLQLIIDSTPALIHTALPDGYIDFFNQTWLRYLGVPLEKMQG
jgi:PAS domain-containing protein